MEINIGLIVINEILLIIEKKEKNKDEIINELKQKIEMLENKLNEKNIKMKLNNEKEKEKENEKEKEKEKEKNDELISKIKLLEDELNEKKNKIIETENKIKLNEEKVKETIEELKQKNKILGDELNEKNNQIKGLENIIKENEINKMKKINKLKTLINNNKFKFENMKNTLTNNKGDIYCLKTLYDGRLAAGDFNSNLIIYNKDTFNPDVIINNNLGILYNFTQLKNKNIACSFWSNSTLKIIKIKENNEYENIQIINSAHNNNINKIIELKNENLITFLNDCSFNLWYLNFVNYYEKIIKIKDSNRISDGIEIKDNEIILYALNTKPQSLVFYDLSKNKKIITLDNLKLYIDCLCRIEKINDNEVVAAGDGKVYLIDINNYLILNEINTDYCNYCILKLSNNLFLIGDKKGTISQFKIENKQLIKESFKNNSHKDAIYSMTILDDMIISGGNCSNEIKIWIN